MHSEPTNAAVEWTRRKRELANSLDDPRAAPKLPKTEDFIAEDRRSGGMNFGTLDASEFDDYLTSMWDVGNQRPQMSMSEVIAVRGDRLAAVAEAIDYGDHTVVDGILCYCLDPRLERLQQVLMLDAEDRDGAIRELDRMYAELDD